MKVDITKLTSKELKELKAKQLDDTFVQKYPDGSFTFQCWDGWNPKGTKAYWGLHWNKRRRTSHTTFKGLSVVCNNGVMKITPYQNNAWGRIKVFVSLDELIAYAKKHGMDNPMIEIFVSEFKTTMTNP